MNKLKSIWLGGIIVFIFLMIFVGGATRLTRSGLSIAEWQPVAGIIPPLSEHQWENHFSIYRQTPQYKLVNSEFTLGDYKKIFYWEYFHRLLGRLLFLFVVIPGAILLRKGAIQKKLYFSLTFAVVLQGTMGWLMVKSGLIKHPRVHPLLLTTHFFLAVATIHLAFIHFSNTHKLLNVIKFMWKHKKWSALGMLLLLQLLIGCLVSGTQAGLVSDSFPLMGGQLIPNLVFKNSLTFEELFYSPIFLQWLHRWIGVGIGLFTFALCMVARQFMNNCQLKYFYILCGIIIIQITMGISLLILQVPISLALAHQLSAVAITMLYSRITLLFDSSASY